MVSRPQQVWQNPVRLGGFGHIRPAKIRENPYSQAMNPLEPSRNPIRAALHGRVGVPIAVLRAAHRPAILRHLLALGEHDRYLRFGYAANDAHIRRYVEGLRFERDEVFGIFNWRMRLIAMAHLAYMVRSRQEQAAEFGVSVACTARGRGYGARLFAHAMRHARNEGVSQLVIHTLSENAPMLAIARKAGASVQREGGESEAHLVLPPADFRSSLSEWWQDGVARGHYALKNGHYRLRRWVWRALARQRTVVS